MNAAETAVCGEGLSTEIVIKGGECFSCWYFFVLEFEDPATADFRLTFSQIEDSIDGQYQSISIDQPAQSFIDSGEFNRRKFILSSSNFATFEVLAASGEVEVYVGLDG